MRSDAQVRRRLRPLGLGAARPNDEVLAVREVPYGQIIYSTADLPKSERTVSEYKLTLEEVIARYVEHAELECSEHELREEVRTLLVEGRGVVA